MKNFLLQIALGVLTLNSCAQIPDKTSMVSSNQQSCKRVTKVEFEQALNSSEKLQIVDVRTPDEYNAGHIGRALNINFLSADFESIILKLDKSIPILIYCQSGRRSSKALSKMKELGFENVLELEYGYSNW